MDILEIYSKALALFHERNFDESLELVDVLKEAAPEWKKSFLLEAYIRREQGELLKEFIALEKLLPRFDLSLPAEKVLAADALSLFGSVCRELGFIEDAVEKFCLSAELEDDEKKSCIEISNALFAANSSEKFSRADFQKLYAAYKKFLTDVEPFPRKIYNHKKIRVGFLSADFKWHVVMAWSWDLLNGLDKNFFATYCYANVLDADNVTEHFQSTVDVWRDISKLSDAEAAKLIRDDEIDILFDLSGHTTDNRLRVAAYRPATVQISGIGYMNSTGIDCFDYFLSDKFCAGDESWFTEKLIRLPHSHICYNSQLKLETSDAPCLKKGFVTFGSFNNFAKVTDSILVAWKKILDRLPRSRLLLKHKIFSTADGRNFVGERLKNFGFDLNRVDMRNYTANHAVDYFDVDIALDTFPYTGGVTTCEALWMGVPVVTLFGTRHGTRFGLSILKNVRLDELAVANFDDYVERAVALASDTELISILRKNLRGMMKKSPLMDAKNYILDIEKVFAEILIDNR